MFIFSERNSMRFLNNERVVVLQKYKCFNINARAVAVTRSRGLAPAPVHQQLDQDHEHADEHGEPHQDQAPAEHGEAVGLRLMLHLLGESELRGGARRPTRAAKFYKMIGKNETCDYYFHLFATEMGIWNSSGSATEYETCRLAFPV